MMKQRQECKNSMLCPEAISDAILNDADRLEQNAFISTPHENLLKQLLEQVNKVDFRELAGFDPSDQEARLKREHYLINVVEQVVSIAERNKWNLCKRDEGFYVYNGAFWKPISKQDIEELLWQAALKMGVDKYTAKYYPFIESLFQQFSLTNRLAAPITERNTVKINLQNGTFVIGPETPNLRAPDAADFLTYQLPFSYNPKAKAPQFNAFLTTVLPDEGCRNVLAEYIGYVFLSTARLKLEKALLLFGSGANGKSVFFEIIMAMLGNENVSNYSLESLTTGHAYCRAHLANKLVNWASETTGKVGTDAFKQLASGESIEARLPYGQPFIMTDYAKLIFNCNELPTDIEQTNAYFRRFLIVPFKVTIPERDQDKQLAAKIIRSELSGVFNWVLAGLERLLGQGRFTDSEVINRQLDDFKKQSDSVRLFLDEYGYCASTDWTPMIEVYSAYERYCREWGYKPVGGRKFGSRLELNGLQTKKRSIGQGVFAVHSGGSI